MAIVVAQNLSASSGTSSASVSVPTLTSGRLLLVVAGNDNGASGVTTPPSVSGGTVTSLGSFFTGAATSFGGFAVWAITGYATKATATTVSVTLNATQTDIVVLEVDGAGATAIVDAAFAHTTGTASTATMPTLTLAAAGDLVLWGVQGFFPFTSPSGTPTPTVCINDSTNETAVGYQLPSGTSYTPVSATTSSGGEWTAFSVAIAPATVPSGTVTPSTRRIVGREPLRLQRQRVWQPVITPIPAPLPAVPAPHYREYRPLLPRRARMSAPPIPQTAAPTTAAVRPRRHRQFVRRRAGGANAPLPQPTVLPPAYPAQAQHQYRALRGGVRRWAARTYNFVFPGAPEPVLLPVVFQAQMWEERWTAYLLSQDRWQAQLHQQRWTVELPPQPRWEAQVDA